MGLQCASSSGVNWMLMFGRLSRNLLLLVLEPLHVHVQDSNTRRWAWPSSGIAQFGDSFIHNHMKLSLSECSTFAKRTGHAIHSGLQVPLPYLEMALRTMVDTRGEGRDGVPLRR